MPFPFLLIGIAAAAAGVGVKKVLEARRNVQLAHELVDDANRRLARAHRRREAARLAAAAALESLARAQLEVWQRDVGAFAEVFGKLKNVELPDAPGKHRLRAFDRHQLLDMTSTSLRAAEVIGGGIGGLGGGALAGVASYGAATMLASASTGTAITTLSGAAATNATLAWFGGGSLAAGGAGMAGGMLVLGGLVAGPAIAVGGLVLASRARTTLAEARITAARGRVQADEMDVAADVLDLLTKTAAAFQTLLGDAASRLRQANDHMVAVVAANGTNYATYAEADRKSVFIAVQLAQVVMILLETPLLAADGSPSAGARRALGRAKKLLGSA